MLVGDGGARVAGLDEVEFVAVVDHVWLSGCWGFDAVARVGGRRIMTND